jgi:hypothetical protein
MKKTRGEKFNRKGAVEPAVCGEEGKKNRHLMYPLCALFAAQGKQTTNSTDKKPHPLIRVHLCYSW